MMDRQNIEIDYCPQCRGVWLDRGELDKLIERSAGNGYSDEKPHSYGRHHDDDNYDPNTQKRKKKSFLGDMFEIFE
jgi:Zn-finger nucleic acid-binding protein